MIETYFTSGTATLVILALMAVEAVILWRWLKLPSSLPLAGEVPGTAMAERGMLLNAMLLGLLAGAAMILALTASIMHYSHELIGTLLALSFVFHLVEVRLWLKTANRLPA